MHTIAIKNRKNCFIVFISFGFYKRSKYNRLNSLFPLRKNYAIGWHAIPFIAQRLCKYVLTDL